MLDSVLTITGLTKQYKNFTLGPIDLRVEKGIVVALLGTNGSGKSTLFRILMGMVQPSEGQLSFFDTAGQMSETEIKQRIGYVGDQFDIMGHLTIKELASLVSYWYPNWSMQKYQELLHRYKVNEHQKYSKCSKGTQKKVQFILAMSYEPELLLLDELTAGVDLVSQRKMREDLQEFMADGEHTIVLASHILDEIRQVSDYIYVLDDGQIIRSFEKDEVHVNWARVWTSHIPAALRQHPHVLEFSEQPMQLVTDDLTSIEAELAKENATITHIQRLNMDEVITFILEATHSD